MALPIDVGPGAVDGNDWWGSGATLIDLANPANLSGRITSVDVWANTNIAGLRVGTFYLVSGTTYKCRGSATIGNVTAGSKQTFAVSIPVVVGDVIGCYFDSGQLENTLSGGVGVASATGEYIDPGDSAAFTVDVNWRQSLYGQGIVRGWSSK